MKKLLHLLWQLPVLVGAGALLTDGARAARSGEVVVKLENDRVYFSQDAGRTFEPLALTATLEAARLKRLLQPDAHAQSGGIVKVAPTVVADGAGGWQWARPQNAKTPDSTVRPAGAVAPARPVAGRDGATNGPKGPAQTKPE